MAPNGTVGRGLAERRAPKGQSPEPTNSDTAVDRAQRAAPGEKRWTTNNALFIAVPLGV
jgi:hypothetical protein